MGDKQGADHMSELSATDKEPVGCLCWCVLCRKGQPTNEMLFGGVSLSENQQESLVVMKETADKGIEVDV
jgi:hypothetical protein